MADAFDINQLNAAQRQAVVTLDGPVLILAGAGTGKTRTVTCRMAHMISQGISPRDILALTFTNKAAAEMAERVAGMVDRRSARQMTICTFHSLCVRILRQDIGALGYKENFSIYTGGDQMGLIKRLIMEFGGRKEKLDAGLVLSELSRVRNLGMDADALEDSLIGAVARAYQRELKNQNAVDFDDLLVLTERLLSAYPTVSAKWNTRFPRITVDEFQDTNSLQMSLLRQLVGPQQHVCVVGDDDQSIYGWRGAQISNILDFESFFPNPAVIKLEENYRCTRQILHCANKVIANNTGRREKILRANKEGIYPVRLISMAGSDEEAQFVAEEIDTLRAQRLGAWEDFAVLFRSNMQSRGLEMALRERHIPYRMVGARSFFDRREVKDILSYLQSMDNPDADLPLLRILNTPARGISSVTIANLLDWSRTRKISVWASMVDLEFLAECSTRTKASLDSFTEMMSRYGSEFAASERSFVDILTDLIAEIGYDDYLAKFSKTDDERSKRQAAVDDIKVALRQFWMPGTKLRDFLAGISLDGERDEEDIEKKSGVCLITMHAAKGLEFPNVYLVGVEEGLIPHTRSVDEGNLDEERRLFYVAITRAREQLTMTYCAKRMKYGKETRSTSSCFIKEIPVMSYEFIDYEAMMNAPASEESCAQFFASIDDILGD